MSERRENLYEALLPDSSDHMLSPQHPQGEGAVQRMTIQRLFALALVLACATCGMFVSLLFMASRDEPERMLGTLRRLPEHISSHALIIGGSVIVAVGGAIGITFIGLALFTVNKLIRPKRADHFILFTPFTLDLPAEEVTFSPLYGDHLVQGIYIARPDASTSSLISPGYRRTYTDLLGMCKHLWMAGHNVLAFDYNGHGTYVGAPITFGYREVNDFLGAVSYAKLRAPEARIGAMGFSMGGAITIMGGARMSDVLAIVADSAFASHRSAIEMALRQELHLPANKGAKAAMKAMRWIADLVLAGRAGYHFHQLEPWREIVRFAPRPVLLVHGLSDTVVPPSDSVRLYEAAGMPKALWHLPETEHSKGYVTDSERYTTKVISFFDHYLKQPALAMHEAEADQDEVEIGLRVEQESRTESLLDGKPGAAHYWQEPFAPTVPVCQPASSAVEQGLMEMVARILEMLPEQVQSTGDFFDYGGDSSSLDMLRSAIAHQWHVQVAAHEVFDHPLLCDLATHIVQRQQQAKQEEIYA